CHGISAAETASPALGRGKPAGARAAGRRGWSAANAAQFDERPGQGQSRLAPLSFCQPGGFPMVRILSSAAMLLALALPVAAQPNEAPPKQLTVQPAAAPTPALKYLLLPEVRDLQPGNAALVYMRAMNPEWYGNVMRHPDWATNEKLLEGPVAKMPRDKVLLPTQSLLEVDLAARREFCDWEM